MLLKKQTVWLLTMLSLVVVLTVYYITSPEQRGQNLANNVIENTDKESPTATSDMEENTESAIITNASNDEVFTALRLKLNEERDELREKLEIRMGSTDLPAEEISAAKDEYNKIDEIAQKEELLETLIRAMNYEDVLVRADGETVLVTVKADKLSPTAANEIIREVTNEIGTTQLVTVEFQPK